MTEKFKNNNIVNSINFKKSLNNSLTRKERIENCVKYNLEELKAMGVISNSEGRPSYHLNDQKWQDEFVIRKHFIDPIKNKAIRRMKGQYDRVLTQGVVSAYNGDTNWKTYCNYINSVLTNIENGDTDFCYYIYQILDLLKFHYNDLRTQYDKSGEYWRVWLEPYSDTDVEYVSK